MSSDGLRKQQQADLDKAKTELANVKKAILNGLDTPITRDTLLECAEKVDALEAERKAPQSRPKVVALSTTVMKHLADLRVTFGRDNDRARSALKKLVSQVVLRRHGDRLMARSKRQRPGVVRPGRVEKNGSMRGLPTGTVTFLFTDIEGSTTLRL